MSGNIKVSGTWRNASNLYIKVGGTWRTALQAYVNVGGSWRIWYNTTISDTFTRANTTTGLGATELGGSLTWNSLIGNFFVNSGTARSDNAVTAGNAGALSYINLNTPNATASVGGQTTTAGVGPAVWVSAAGSWWAAIGSNGQTNTTYTYSCNCTCNGHSVCNTCANPAFGTYTGTTYYSPTAHDEFKVYTNVTTYSNSGSTPTTSSSTSYSYAGSATSSSATVATRYCTAANAANPSNSCPYTGYSGQCRSDATGATCSYTCPSGQQSGATCYDCGSNTNGNLCCGTSANSCYTPVTTTTTTCATGTYYASPPSGCTSGCCNSSTSLQWTSCSQGATLGSSCQVCDSGPQNLAFQGNPTTGGYGYYCTYNYTYYGTGTSCTYCGTTFISGGTANSSTGAGCDSYGFTCQTCTGGSITTNYYMQIIKATSTGAPYTIVSTSADYGTQISNISITTSDNNLTATAYGTTGSSLGTLTTTNTGTKNNGVGIVKGYSAYNQSSTGDNFSATAGAITYIPVEYLVVGGGGGGGNVAGGGFYGGGGGAGGLLSGTVNVNVATAQTLTVGGGGAGGTYASSPHGNNGGNSQFGSFTAIGGGGGGRGAAAYVGCYDSAGSNGGSGGGGPCGGGTGTAGQGYAGGGGDTGGASGGGGAGGAGTTSGGGPGVSSSITGTAVTYAAGGFTWSYPGTVTGIGSGGHGAFYNSQTSSSGNSGTVILAYLSTYADLVISGLTYNRSTTSRLGYKVYTFTGGTGTVTI